MNDLLAVEVPHRITLSVLHFSHIDMAKLKEEIKNRFTILRKNMEERFPMIPILAEDSTWAFEIKTDGDGIPSVELNDWLQQASTKGAVAAVDFSKISDGDWVQFFRIYKKDYPEMVDITPEMKLIIEFNDHLNAINDEWHEVDYTDVIEEIIKATKEGKL
mgnify:CR=1 FL=1